MVARRDQEDHGFWLALGVSGFRVDAAPFVIALRGANAEKQPHESFDYLEEFVSTFVGRPAMLFWWQKPTLLPIKF